MIRDILRYMPLTVDTPYNNKLYITFERDKSIKESIDFILIKMVCEQVFLYFLSKVC